MTDSTSPQQPTSEEKEAALTDDRVALDCGHPLQAERIDDDGNHYCDWCSDVDCAIAEARSQERQQGKKLEAAADAIVALVHECKRAYKAGDEQAEIAAELKLDDALAAYEELIRPHLGENIIIHESLDSSDLDKVTKKEAQDDAGK